MTRRWFARGPWCASVGRAACLLLAAIWLPSCAAEVDAAPVPEGDSIVYVIGRGWHTDIGLPVEEITPPLTALTRGFPGVRYLTIGFGERQFLLTRHPSPFAVLGALLPSRSAVLMTALRASPEAAFGAAHVVVLHVSRDGLARIEARLWRELQTTPDGEPMLLAQGPYPGSVYYAARGTYDGLHTCNTWTAVVLREGGLPVRSSGVLFAEQIMQAARRIAARQASIRGG